jgi:hypothetical protein
MPVAGFVELSSVGSSAVGASAGGACARSDPSLRPGTACAPMAVPEPMGRLVGTGDWQPSDEPPGLTTPRRGRYHPPFPDARAHSTLSPEIGD